VAKSNDRKKAQVQAIAWLTMREYSEVELTEKLLEKGYVQATVKAVISDLIAQGLQSDARLIEGWIAKRQRQGYGPYRIQQELLQKGIPSTAIMMQLEFTQEVWQTTLSRIYLQKFGDKIPKTIKERWSQMQMLQRRGFTKPQILQFFAEQTDGLLAVDELGD
jgi:regulatory protein